MAKHEQSTPGEKDFYEREHQAKAAIRRATQKVDSAHPNAIHWTEDDKSGEASEKHKAA